MVPKHTLIFNRSNIQSLMSLKEYIDVVENAFRLYAEKKILTPDLLHVNSDEGEFHIKVGGIKLPKIYFGLKSNGGFFNNQLKYGLPSIQGLILLHDGENGFPLAIFESGDITIKRTGAATAVATKYLALENADTATICGCGIQGRIQLESIMQVRNIKKVFAYDQDSTIMKRYVKEMGGKMGVEIMEVTHLGDAVQKSQIAVCCTPTQEKYFLKEYAHKGLFVAAVGADSPDKQELDPELMKGNKVIADILHQCIEVGEVHHAIGKGLIIKEDVFAELGDIIIGKSKGRESDNEVIIYDATGTALQDVAVAAFIYEKAIKQNVGLPFQFPT